MRRSTVAAIGSTGLVLSVALYSALADVLLPVRAGVPGAGASPPEVALVAVFVFGTPVIGGLIAARRPGDPIGWLFLLLAFGFAISFASDDYVRHAQPDATAAWVGTIGSNLGGTGLLAFLLLLMLFPTGRLPSPRWRWLPIMAVIGVAANTVGTLFAPGSPVTPAVPGLMNPLGQPSWQPQLALLAAAGQLCFLVVLLGSFGLLIARFRDSQGRERQQLKWFVWGGSVPAVLLVSVLVADTALPGFALGDVLWVLAVSSLVLIPLGAAIAILRYRLYDIDRIISRTVSYAALTAVLGAVYVAGSLGLEAALVPLTKGGGVIAVAASTLAVFALFQPVRRRIQAVVDRRFNRSRYDAEREVERFAAHVRDEVEVERVAEALAATLVRTMQPASAAVWLRAEGER